MAKLKPHFEDAPLPSNDDSPVLTLRDRKKARQRTEMLGIALRLFKEKGFDNTRMEDIAALADVSTPTVYNYFQTKADLLVELLKKDRENSKPRFDSIIAHPPAEPVEALADLLYANLDCIRSSSDKTLWREILAAVARSHDKEQDSFEKNHGVFKRYIKILVMHFIKTGKLTKTLPVDTAVEVIFAINSHNIRHIASSERCTPEKMNDIARQQLKLLLSDWQDTSKRTATKSKPKTSR
jgi:AcrR family transcriptional regulator